MQGIALVAAVAWTVLALKGVGWLRELRFPVAYLLFMIPLPDRWLLPLILRLQLLVSSVAVALLRQAGLSVYRDGNVIELPGGSQLFVAEACSGITSLLTVIPLAVFLAYPTQRRFAARAWLDASVLPLALGPPIVN